MTRDGGFVGACIYCGSSDTVPMDFGPLRVVATVMRSVYPDARHCQVCDMAFDPAPVNRPPPRWTELRKQRKLERAVRDHDPGDEDPRAR